MRASRTCGEGRSGPNGAFGLGALLVVVLVSCSLSSEAEDPTPARTVAAGAGAAAVSSPAGVAETAAEEEAGEAAPATAEGTEATAEPAEETGETGPDVGEALGRFKSSIDRGSRYLAENQNPDGGYGPYGMIVPGASDVGITAFCLYALARNPRNYSAADGPFISRAVKFLLDRQQADGAFYDPKDPSLQNYKTSVAVLALDALDRVKYAQAVRKARDFLQTQQATPAGGYDPDEHVNFGGQGYGSSLRRDLSNAQFAAEALYKSGLSASDEYWAHLVVFVSRCQNAETLDPLLEDLGIGTSGDGGFRYAPNDTRGPVETLDDGSRIFSSYGSMSYAGLKTLLYARVDREDPRVQQAFAWISRNFSVEVNPGMATRENPAAGLHGLFYYYHTMAKALSVYGERLIRDARGGEHDWALELGTHLVDLQQKDGHWVNTSDRWYENLPALDTAYATVALAECLEFIKSRTEGE